MARFVGLLFLMMLFGCLGGCAQQRPADVEYHYQSKRYMPPESKIKERKTEEPALSGDVLYPVTDDDVIPEERPGKPEPRITYSDVSVAEEQNNKPDVQGDKNDRPVLYKRGNGFIMPANGRIISSFGRVNNRFNDGVLLGLSEGQEIVASSDGSVVYVGQELREYGNMIIVEHRGDVITSYAQIKQVNVKTGEKVKKGSVIGYAGKIGDISPRVLFSIRVNGGAVDPMKYVTE